MAFAHGLIKWLLCAHACSDQAKLSFLQLLFPCDISQITLFMQNWPCTHVISSCASVCATINLKIIILFPFTFSITLVSDHSFYEKFAVHAMFLAPVHATMLKCACYNATIKLRCLVKYYDRYPVICYV